MEGRQSGSKRAKVEKKYASDLIIVEKEKYGGSANTGFESRYVLALAIRQEKVRITIPGDDPDKVLYDKLEKVVPRLIFETVWEISNRKKGINRIT